MQEELYDLGDSDFSDADILADDIILEEVNLQQHYQEEAAFKMVFPCLVIDGLCSEEEFLYFKKRPFDDSVALPLYCYVDDIITHIGSLDLTMDTLLSVRSIAGYKLTLHKDREHAVEILLNRPEFLQRFIRL